mmetsp:Transcript_27678/g.60283  ORF Transcript_27678/g.60283 Transcript_27678/m.60283 type:complete len:97 (-) Transcript_27678:4-294(-)
MIYVHSSVAVELDRRVQHAWPSSICHSLEHYLRCSCLVGITGSLPARSYTTGLPERCETEGKKIKKGIPRPSAHRSLANSAKLSVPPFLVPLSNAA